MEMMTEGIGGGAIPPLPELVASLEQATFMAKQLPTTTDPTQILQIYSSLTTAHHHLSSFLSHHHPPAENSVSSAFSPSTTANNMEAEPMQVGDNGEEEEEENSKNTIDVVEEQMRDCFIRNKRAKRAISPSLAAATERGRSSDDGFARAEDVTIRDGTPLEAYLTDLESPMVLDAVTPKSQLWPLKCRLIRTMPTICFNSHVDFAVEIMWYEELLLFQC